MSKNNLADNIKRLRKVNRLTQTELAEKLYVAPQTVSKWEKGITSPDVEKMCALADILNVSVDNLVRGGVLENQDVMLAIDGGGTKTDFILFDKSGKIFDYITLGGSNPNAYGMDQSKKVLCDGIDQLLSRGYRVCFCFAGISGASVGENKIKLDKFLRSSYPFIKFRVDGDIHNIINSAGSVEKCIGVISGTGSVVYGYDGVELHRVGGWGYLFDEAGSGFDLGRELFRYCLACEDGMEEKSELYFRVCDSVGEPIFDNLSAIYAKGKDYVASFAPLVFEFYRKGDKIAINIVNKTVDRLAELITVVSAKYDCGNDVIISGGVATGSNIIQKLLKERLDQHLNLIVPQMPPIFGASVKCLKLFGEKFDIVNFERNFRESLKKEKIASDM